MRQLNRPTVPVNLTPYSCTRLSNDPLESGESAQLSRLMIESAAKHDPTYRPVTHRLFSWFATTVSVPPALIGALLSLALGGVALWITFATGTVANVAAGIVPSIAVRAPVTLFMMVGYLPVATYYLFVWTTTHHEIVVRRMALDNAPVEFPRTSANWLGTLGIGAMYFLFLHVPEDPYLLFAPMRWPVQFTFPLVGLVIMGWFNFRFAFLLIWCALAVSRTARQIGTFNLLDTSLVKPYGQQGVRSSLLAVISLSISANLWLDPGSPAAGTGTSVVMLSSAALIALFLPTWGIHQQLKSAKSDELKLIRSAIASRRDLESRTVDDAQHLRADLAVERRLLEVSEWPFDAGSYGRVVLYVFLGFGSWIGAALVEQLLESFAS